MEGYTVRTKPTFVCASFFAVILFVLSVRPLLALDDKQMITEIGFVPPGCTSLQGKNDGSGFGSGAHVLGASLGVTEGMRNFLGSKQRHNLFVGSISYGQMIGGLKGGRSWYRGGYELCGEILGGSQFHPENANLIGLAGHVRYNFLATMPLVPYVGLGAGATLTEIREPDLGGAFQFNIQALAGTNYWFRRSTGISLELRYVHLSSAWIYSPNRGVNTMGVFLGIKRIF